jgi:ElaB/YqjD/DUF883 family membrane-anchored ribosome-binding protein
MEMKTSNITADYDAVVRQLAELKSEMANLVASMGKATNIDRSAIVRDVSEGMNEAANYMGRKGQEADVRFESAIVANPYMALAMAAGAGLLLGAMTRR